MRHPFIPGTWAGAALGALLLAGCGALIPTATPTPTATSTPTITPSPTTTSTPSPAPTDTPPPTDTPTITPTPSPYDGDWSGQTSEGLPITFSVGGQVVSGMSIGCKAGIAGVSATMTFSPPDLNGPIVDGRISFSSLAGTFHSPTSASGTLTSQPDLALCKLLNISWNATRK